jgi:hypothetical protein
MLRLIIWILTTIKLKIASDRWSSDVRIISSPSVMLQLNAPLFFIFYGTCKAHGIDPYAWLKDVLARFPYHPQNRIQEMLLQF